MVVVLLSGHRLPPPSWLLAGPDADCLAVDGRTQSHIYGEFEPVVAARRTTVQAVVSPCSSHVPPNLPLASSFAVLVGGMGRGQSQLFVQRQEPSFVEGRTVIWSVINGLPSGVKTVHENMMPGFQDLGISQ